MTAIRSAASAAAFLLIFLCVGCEEVVLPTVPSTAPVTETFASLLSPRGIATRSFRVRETGRVTVTLTSLSPDSRVVGLGVGIPRSDGGGCYLNLSVNAGPSASPHMTTTAEGGNYCVMVYDLGTLDGPVSFSITVEHP